MEITLGSKSAARIRAVLGDDVDLSPAAVPRVLARLADESPALYSEILDQLSGSDVRLDSERMLHRRHRRNALRRTLFGWGEYESDAGDRLLAKRRVAAAVPFVLAAVMLAAGGISSLLHRPTDAPAARVPVRATRPAGPPARSERTKVPPPPARFDHMVAGEFAGRRSAGEGSRWPPSPSGRAVLAAVAEPPAARTTAQLPPVPTLPLPGPAGFGLTSTALPPPIVFSRPQASAAGSDQRDAVAPRSPVVYARDAATDTAQPPEPRSASSAGPHATPDPKAVKIGDRIPARLVTAVIVTADSPPVPVVAQSNDGSTWLGYAALQSDRRIHISFREVDRDGAGPSGVPVSRAAFSSGVALDPEQASPGLPGRLVIRRGATAVAAIAAIAQAASEYVQAIARAGQLSVSDGAAQISLGGPAPGWTYAASHFADMFNPQTARVAIETFEIGSGTPCLILITGAP